MFSQLRRSTALVALVVFAAVFSTFAADPTPSPSPSTETEPEPIRVVRAYIDAFNRHDIPAMAERVGEEFVWFNVTSDRATVEVKGRDSLRKTLANYFRGTPTVRSEIEGIVSAGDYVSFRERASWTSLLGQRSQSSLAVYEVKGGLITRAWYYPAAK
jgi:hypothetical protein